MKSVKNSLQSLTKERNAVGLRDWTQYKAWKKTVAEEDRTPENWKKFKLSTKLTERKVFLPFKGTRKVNTLHPLDSKQIALDIEGLVDQARSFIKRTVEAWWNLGRVTAKAKELGCGVREFSAKVGLSHEYLYEAMRAFEKYPTFDKVPKELVSIKLLREDVQTPSVRVEESLKNAELPEPTVPSLMDTARLEALKSDLKVLQSSEKTAQSLSGYLAGVVADVVVKEEAKFNPPIKTTESVQQSLLTYGPRSKELFECLHRFVRDGNSDEAMRVAWELAKGDRATVTAMWNEIQLMSDEETTDPLTILAVDALWHRVRDGEGRISSNGGIAVRCAMVAAYLLSIAPKDRSSDDSFLLERIRADVTKSVDSTNALLATKFEPVVAPDRSLMHRGGKFGLEGNVAMALTGSKTSDKTERYTKFRAEFERIVRELTGGTAIDMDAEFSVAKSGSGMVEE